MSEGMIIRRGGGGGFDPTGAVLKVVTSAGCTVNVSGTSYSRTQTDAEGFPRSGDANVVEHFFNIPSTAFGTIAVTATNTYGTNTKTLTVNTAGKVYELLLGGPNILLNSVFGKQEGFSISDAGSGTSSTYDSDYKTYTLRNITAATTAGFFAFSNSYNVSLYDKIKITAKKGSSATAEWRLTCINKDNSQVFNVQLNVGTEYVSDEVTLTDKAKSPFTFKISEGTSNRDLIINEISFI